MKSTMTVLAFAATVALLAAGTVLVVGMPGSQSGSSTQSTGTASSLSSASTTSTTSHLSNATASENMNDSLQLRLSLNATTINPGQTLMITISEFNTLSTANNVTASDSWALDGLELGPCGHSYGPNQGPLGVEVFSGHYTAANISQAQPLGVYPSPIACPQFIRLMTGFLFQPLSDRAYVLPDYGGNATGVSGGVAVGREYTDLSSVGQPLNPGLYTIAGGDEWGSLLLLYVDVR